MKTPPKPLKLKHQFVDGIPADPAPGVLYVSIKYRTAVHRCCCGCGGKVVTPLRPDFWSVTFNGESVSLSPSIGNWSFSCRSHYWITDGTVEWASDWSRERIDRSRAADAAQRARRRRSKSGDAP